MRSLAKFFKRDSDEEEKHKRLKFRNIDIIGLTLKMQGRHGMNIAVGKGLDELLALSKNENLPENELENVAENAINQFKELIIESNELISNSISDDVIYQELEEYSESGNGKTWVKKWSDWIENWKTIIETLKNLTKNKNLNGSYLDRIAEIVCSLFSTERTTIIDYFYGKKTIYNLHGVFNAKVFYSIIYNIIKNPNITSRSLFRFYNCDFKIWIYPRLDKYQVLAMSLKQNVYEHPKFKMEEYIFFSICEFCKVVEKEE